MPSVRGNITERENLLLRRALDPASTPAEGAKAMEAFANSLRKRGMNGYDFVPADGPRNRPSPEPPKSEPPPPPEPPPKYEPKPPPPREETPPWWTRAKDPPPPYEFYRHSNGKYWPFPERKYEPPEDAPPESPWTKHSMEPDFQHHPRQHQAPRFPELAAAWEEIRGVLALIIGLAVMTLFGVAASCQYSSSHQSIHELRER